jgi:DNA-binding winged helix-turn-helix (wHTH) protein
VFQLVRDWGESGAHRVTLLLDPDTQCALIEGDPVPLTRREFDLLAVLARHPGRLVTREQLLDEVWQTRYVEPGTVTEHVRRLRLKLRQPDPASGWLRTVRGRGYRLELPRSADGAARGSLGQGSHVLGDPGEEVLVAGGRLAELRLEMRTRLETMLHCALLLETSLAASGGPPGGREALRLLQVSGRQLASLLGRLDTIDLPDERPAPHHAEHPAQRPGLPPTGWAGVPRQGVAP